MPLIFGLDHRILAGTTVLCTAGLAAYSSYNLYALRRQNAQASVYETQKSLHEYLLFHYGSEEETIRFDSVPTSGLEFPKRCAELCLKHFGDKADPKNMRALDVGCAVGRSTFELCRFFPEVIGIDYSKLFVDACNSLKDHGHMQYVMPVEGELVQNLDAKVDSQVDRSRATFQTGDACGLPLDIGQFDCVLAANLVDRLHTPLNFLNRLLNLLRPGGVLVITTPYTFLTEFTKRDQWFGGFMSEKTGKPVTGFDGLKQHLSASFDLLETKDLPMLIRETARKHQFTVAHATVWKRKQL